MKYYESNYEEYIQSVSSNNIHPELLSVYNKFPHNIEDMENIILYGGSGVGKYSQMLYLIRRYSPSDLKHNKKMTIQTEKITYVYHISDIHYEIDMSLLGCNSKILWNEIFLQITDIISMNPQKSGIIVCKNFHMIHSELLEIFYSYIQQSKWLNKWSGMNIKIHFILLTEHLGFIPNNIINCFYTIRVKRPDKEQYSKILTNKTGLLEQRISSGCENSNEIVKLGSYSDANEILEDIDESYIINAKELYLFPKLQDGENVPNDIFNIICDNIIKEMSNFRSLEFSNFREIIYDILIYNLEMTECLWYVLHHFVMAGCLLEDDVLLIIEKIHVFLKQYNNNYRPIYHVESILFFIIDKLRRNIESK